LGAFSKWESLGVRYRYFSKASYIWTKVKSAALEQSLLISKLRKSSSIVALMFSMSYSKVDAEINLDAGV
jgi:hypothetical protein